MADARRIARQRLESLQRAGVTGLPRARLPEKNAPSPPSEPAAATTSRTVSDSPQPPAPPSPVAQAPATPSPASMTPPSRLPAEAPAARPPLAARVERQAALDLINLQVKGCVRCAELCTTRKNTVFGVGNPMTRLCFLGEAPGADEDAQGEPFVGRAGQLLDKIIEACTLRREEVYILNILKCRPPGNRPPLDDESANCREYLNAQLEIIRPEYICCLGATAAKNLLGTDVSIGKLRGKFQNYRGAKVMCTYHPAYLLRNPAAKRDVWEDMKTLMRDMGVELEKK